jgi:hypothetical protein
MTWRDLACWTQAVCSGPDSKRFWRGLAWVQLEAATLFQLLGQGVLSSTAVLMAVPHCSSSRGGAVRPALGFDCLSEAAWMVDAYLLHLVIHPAIVFLSVKLQQVVPSRLASISDPIWHLTTKRVTHHLGALNVGRRTQKGSGTLGISAGIWLKYSIAAVTCVVFTCNL